MVPVVVDVGAGSWRMVPAVPAGDFAAAVDGTDLSYVSYSMRHPKRREGHRCLGHWNIGSPIETMWMMPWLV